MTEVWSRERVREVLHQLRQLPDFDCLPLPEAIYKEYNIPIPPKKITHFMDYINRHQKARDAPVESFEIRESDHTLREVKGEEPPKLIICATQDIDKVINEIADETSEPQNQNQAQTTESIGSDSREYLAYSSSPPSQSDASNITLSV